MSGVSRLLTAAPVAPVVPVVPVSPVARATVCRAREGATLSSDAVDAHSSV